MRIPIRRSQRLKITPAGEDVCYVTKQGLQELEARLKRLEEQHTQAIRDVQITAERGDFSENAEYQEAKARMRRLDASIFTLKDKIKRASVIQTKANGRVQLGSVVVVEDEKGMQQTFQIVGAQETDPSRGRISHVSPFGSSLMGRCAGEEVEVERGDGKIMLKVKEVRNT
jgi:transcription elongation GreA/GreB family factor